MKTAANSKSLARDLDPGEQVDEYIASAPGAAQGMLRQLRRLIRASAPQADERLSYRMPYYSVNGRLIYFAAFSKHVGVYIMGRSKEQFAKELKPWRTSASTLQFPFGTKLPVALLSRLVKARVAENLAAKAKAARPTKAAARPGAKPVAKASPRRSATPRKKATPSRRTKRA